MALKLPGQLKFDAEVGRRDGKHFARDLSPRLADLLQGGATLGDNIERQPGRSPSMRTSMDLISYLETLPSAKLSRLYGSSAVCATVLRNLPLLAGQYVTRLAFSDVGIPQGIVSSWASTGAQIQHDSAMDKLLHLHILKELEGKSGHTAYVLDPTFRHNIQEAMLSGYCGGYMHKQPLAAAPDQTELTVFATKQWEDLLMYLIGSGSTTPKPPLGLEGFDMEGLLASASLVGIEAGPRHPRITEEGFQFLLMHMYQQLWMLIQQYISQAEKSSSGIELLSVVQFLLNVGMLDGRSIMMRELKEVERPVAMHMAQIGLLMPFKSGGDVWLAPTPLTSVLTEGSAASSGTAAGFVIVETNFRVYAYTTSTVQQAILRFFVRCDVLLPNLFVGTITRESVMSALECGITADQIVAYLRNNAHPRILRNVPIVPGVVSDQIGLWEWETQRLQMQRGVLYSNFETKALFEKFHRFVIAKGFHLFVSAERHQIVAQVQAHEECKSEIKRIKAAIGM